MVKQVQEVDFSKELVIVNDGFTDGTPEWLYEWVGQVCVGENERRKESWESRTDRLQVRVFTHQHD
ncbi:MAG: hypothetical protein OEZ57_03600 [Nitrospirota bacterium]|nr:hypothetical protein [Nitrospirota bacterium]MDH5773985.1 hypothetical protein [Nitrospirota bacterium]